MHRVGSEQLWLAEVSGAPAWDVALNFIQRWNHHKGPEEEALVPRMLSELTAQAPKGTLQCQVTCPKYSTFTQAVKLWQPLGYSWIMPHAL